MSNFGILLGEREKSSDFVCGKAKIITKIVLINSSTLGSAKKAFRGLKKKFNERQVWEGGRCVKFENSKLQLWLVPWTAQNFWYRPHLCSSLRVQDGRETYLKNCPGWSPPPPPPLVPPASRNRLGPIRTHVKPRSACQSQYQPISAQCESK